MRYPSSCALIGRVARVASTVLFVAAVASGTTAVCAQTPILHELQTITSSTTGFVEKQVSITAPGSYVVTLTDVGATLPSPAPLASVELAVFYNDAIVGQPLVGAPLANGVGTLTFNASAAGTYDLRIVGVPGSTAGSGPIGIQVASSSGGTPFFSASGVLVPAAAAVPSSEGVLDATVNDNSNDTLSSGSYQITLSDLQLPQPPPGQSDFATLTLILIDQTDGTSVLILPDPTHNGAMTGTVSLDSSKTYRILAVGNLATAAVGGLFSVAISPATGSSGSVDLPVASWAVPVGATLQLGQAVTVTSGGAHTLTVKDLSFPEPLSQLGVAIVLGGQVVAQVSASGGTQGFSAAGGATYSIFGIATPTALSGSGSSSSSSSSSSPSSSASSSSAASSSSSSSSSQGAGSYVVQVQPPSGPLEVNIAQPAVTPGSSLAAYTFTTPLSAAGTYTATLNDFNFPSALNVGMLAAVQGGSLAGTPVTAPGSFTLSGATGQLTLIAFAEGGQGGSLMDVSVTSGGGNVIFDQPQGVGVGFNATPFTVSTPGNVVVTTTDLQFPTAFANLVVIVTQGSKVLGEVVGGTSLPAFQASPGTYYANVLAIPATSNPNGVAGAGTFTLTAMPGPAAPTVNLSADATSVASGGTVHLVWTTQNATSCTGSGSGWSGTWTGAQAASDTVTSPPITSNATFTLTCQGPGGSTAQSVTIDVTSSSGKGGGGAIGWGMLLMLAGCLVWRSKTSF